MDKIKQDIVSAIKLINESSNGNIKARPKTIQSFLKGKTKSPYYRSVFKLHPSICGSQPNVYLQTLKKELRLLVESQNLIKDVNDYQLPNKKNVISLDFLQSNSRLVTISNEEFLQLTDWNIGHNVTPKTNVKTLDGWNFPADSKEEVSIIKKLNKMQAYSVLRGQSYEIPYTTKDAKKAKKYYPDIVMLTKEHHVAIIEVKPLELMCNYYSLEKYKALKEYAKQNGYLYVMCDRNFKTIENLVSKRIPHKIQKYFYDILEKENCFKDSHFKEFTEGLSTKRKKVIHRDFCSLVIQERLINKSKWGFDIKTTRKIKKAMKSI